MGGLDGCECRCGGPGCGRCLADRSTADRHPACGTGARVDSLFPTRVYLGVRDQSHRHFARRLDGGVLVGEPDVDPTTGRQGRRRGRPTRQRSVLFSRWRMGRLFRRRCRSRQGPRTGWRCGQHREERRSTTSRRPNRAPRARRRATRVGNRVEVRPTKIVAGERPGQRRPGVSGFVELWLQADRRELFFKPRAGAGPHRTPGDALAALVVGGQCCQLGQIANNARCIGHDRSCRCSGSTKKSNPFFWHYTGANDLRSSTWRTSTTPASASMPAAPLRKSFAFLAARQPFSVRACALLPRSLNSDPAAEPRRSISADRGFDVLGIDLSAAMVKLARGTAPLATICRRLAGDTPIPRCGAIIALGEVVNYLVGRAPRSARPQRFPVLCSCRARARAGRPPAVRFHGVGTAPDVRRQQPQRQRLGGRRQRPDREVAADAPHHHRSVRRREAPPFGGDPPRAFIRSPHDDLRTSPGGIRCDDPPVDRARASNPGGCGGVRKHRLVPERFPHNFRLPRVV